ncbi:MAG TPA: hypothetical protein PLQ57_02575 [Saprospiraceae bacterium]|nr:hypothetical protein [Saprospiraceae bacterium]HRG64194.1 hypothetical protein [Saprospiraceae bacterium]
MKPIILGVVLFLTTLRVFGQKADIDNYWVDISTAVLPDNKVSTENRTYSLRINGDPEFTGEDVIDRIKIYGWTKADENPYLELIADVGSFIKGTPSTTSRRVDNTDKNGKVTSSTTYYKVSAYNRNRGTLYINGVKNSYKELLADEAEMKRKAEKEKKELEKKQKEKDKKKESKEDKEKKEMENNPFLKNVETKVDEVPEVEEQGGPVSAKETVYKISLDNSYEHTTREYTSSIAASKEYSDNAYAILNQHRAAYKTDMINTINNNANYSYGYRPIKEMVRFKRLDSEDHPEFSMFDNATKALKIIFGKMRYNQNIDQIKSDLEPIIGYFASVAGKLKRSDEKHEKRLRAACYYNLAQIYYYLDDHDKVIAIGNEIIQSKHDEDDGEDFIKKAETVKKVLAFHDMKSRHIDVRSQEESTEDLGESVNENAKN